MRRVGAALACLLMAGGARAQEYGDLASARIAARQAVTAYRAQQWDAYREQLRQALAVQPQQPVWLFNLAGAHARLGERSAALAVLDSLAALGYALDPSADEDFADLAADSGFNSSARRLRANGAPLGDGEVAVRIPDAEFLPEGVAYDPASGSLFVSSVYQRRIVRVRAGVMSTFADSSDGLWSVLGMAVAERTHSLWLVTAVTPAMRGATGHPRRSALVELDLADGRVRRRFEPDSGAHAFNDLTIAEDGAIYIADTGENSVWRWTEAGGLERWIAPGVLLNPSGLAHMTGTEWLYIADYPVGIARISTRTRQVQRLAHAPGTSTFGVDGLVRHGRDLIVIQNALPPHRVARVILSADGARIDTLEVLERGRPEYDEPTLGVVAGDALLYVANSRWSSFRDGAYIGERDATGPVIIRLPLPAR